MRVAVHHDKEMVLGDAHLTMVVQWNALYTVFVFFIAAWAAYLGKLVDRPDRTMSDLDRAWYTASLGVLLLVEPVRLYLGVRGNRIMSVSHLVGFVILTACVHMPIMALYNTNIPFGNSLDWSVSVIELSFGAIELLLGVFALNALIRRNTVDFFVHLGYLDPTRRYDQDDTSSASSDSGSGSEDELLE